MNKAITVNVPDKYVEAPFYKENQQLTFLPTDELKILLHKPFLIDMYSGQLNINEPWKQGDIVLEELYLFWKEQELILANFFKNRDKRQSKEGMRIAIAAFIDFLFWSNHFQVKSLCMITEQIDNLRYKPINCQERLQYIVSNSNQYQSFIQLQQLFTEVYKGYKKELVRNQ
jgi:hypothetical protein